MVYDCEGAGEGRCEEVGGMGGKSEMEEEVMLCAASRVQTF